MEVRTPDAQTTIAVAMSGGVDSSVAAAMMLEQGYAVVGLTLRLLNSGQNADDIRDAQRVAEKLGITHHVADAQDEFRRIVIDDFCSAYSMGRTPNPCVRCNESIKFGLLRRKAVQLGAQHIATGHYVQKARDPADDRFTLRTGHKGDDQSYFLYALSQEQLSTALFPLGNLTKQDVRQMARESGLPVHDRSDSQDLCFVPDGDYRAFLRARCPAAFVPGPIVDTSGQAMGTHSGIGAYTIGQRRGLGIAHSEPLYVVGFDVPGNTVIVGEGRHILRSFIRVSHVNWMVTRPQETVYALVKVRSKHAGTQARVTALRDGRAEVTGNEPFPAPCPGQAAVFYRGDQLLGGGIIEESQPNAD